MQSFFEWFVIQQAIEVEKIVTNSFIQSKFNIIILSRKDLLGIN